MSRQGHKKLVQNYEASKYPEFAFLDMVAHEVENFRPGFRTRYSKIRKTFILSTTISAGFGVEVAGNRAFVGVPEIFFNSLFACRLDSICVVEGQPGFFLILTMGMRHELVAIRIFCSKKRAEMLSKCEDAWVMAIDESGESLPASDRNQFELGIIRKSGLDWE